MSKDITTIHILVNCFWKSGMSGGDRRVIEIVKRWLTHSDCHLVVYAPQSFMDILLSEVESIETHVTDLGVSENTGIISSYAVRTKNLNNLLDKYVQDGDIIYSSSDIMPDVIPAVHCKKHKEVKWVLLTHHINETFYKRPGNMIVNFLSCYQQAWGIRKGVKYSDLYFVISPQVMDEFKRRKYPMDKFRRIDNAVDLKLIDSSNMESEQYDAVFMARLSPSKGVMELLEIWSKVVKAFPNARLGIIGKGKEDMVFALKKRINDIGLEKNIDLLGFVETKVGFSLIKKAKLFVFTSHEEGWGIAVAEALACGTPVVAYNLPVFSVLFKEGIVLCDLKDVDAMSENVIKLLNDDKKCKELGIAGEEYVRSHYSWDNIANGELETILNYDI